jgi:hypothetical protein
VGWEARGGRQYGCQNEEHCSTRAMSELCGPRDVIVVGGMEDCVGSSGGSKRAKMQLNAPQLAGRVNSLGARTKLVRPLQIDSLLINRARTGATPNTKSQPIATRQIMGIIPSSSLSTASDGRGYGGPEVPCLMTNISKPQGRPPTPTVRPDLRDMSSPCRKGSVRKNVCLIERAR